MGQSLVEAALI